MRRIILIALGVVVLFLAFLAARSIANAPKEENPAKEAIRQTVFVDTVVNRKIPIVVPATGSLVAKDRLELYAEVEGLFLRSDKEFRAGQSYKKGQLLLQIDAAEYAASVQSARSNLYNLITALMPDLRLDYPDAYQKWQDYLKNFKTDRTTPPLPETSSEQERYFITGRNIYTTFFEIKNMEERLVKYTIRAPFDGILTEAPVNRGTLIRPGQKLGEFINPAAFEMEVAVSKDFVDFLEVGRKVQLNNLQNTKSYEGTVGRINARVDQSTQTVNVFIDIKGDNLREGMYLEAMLDAREEENAYKIPRKLLVNENQVYSVNDSILELQDVELVYATEKDVVVKGIPDSTRILSDVLPGAYAGKLVKIQPQEKKESNSKEN